ncbi:MAG: hypothetical protein WA364_12865 [Candidatus Nitrosopolaris sp.]
MNIINPDYMEIKWMVDYGNNPPVNGYDYKIATGLYIHSSKDIIPTYVVMHSRLK